MVLSDLLRVIAGFIVLVGTYFLAAKIEAGIAKQNQIKFQQCLERTNLTPIQCSFKIVFNPEEIP